MDISATMVKDLRERTGAGILDCRNALVEAKGDIEGAIEYLKKKGLSKASKKAGRATGEGLIGSYIHQGGKIGVLVEVNCETDFVAKTEDFQNLVKDIAMQIAAASPLFVKREDMPAELIEKERDVYISQVKEAGKPDHVIEKIVEGKLEKYYKDVCLLEQPFIRDQEITVKGRIDSYIAKLGENISVKRFARFKVGEDS